MWILNEWAYEAVQFYPDHFSGMMKYWKQCRIVGPIHNHVMCYLPHQWGLRETCTQHKFHSSTQSNPWPPSYSLTTTHSNSRPVVSYADPALSPIMFRPCQHVQYRVCCLPTTCLAKYMNSRIDFPRPDQRTRMINTLFGLKSLSAQYLNKIKMNQLSSNNEQTQKPKLWIYYSTSIRRICQSWLGN